MSIESQLSSLRHAFEDKTEIEIVAVYEEAFSAKAPGRPRLNEMLSRIERGDAEGIVAWAPDRLARNSIDGGRIVYLLDRGVIHDLKFATYTFENNSQGKFMLQIMFGQSKYYSDALSENVKRGNRTKIEKGWRPNMAPLGYLNDKPTKTTVKDPVHFPLIRKMFDLMLSGVYSPKQIALTARDEWGFRTPQKKRIGGNPLAMSSIYKILCNPFYAGIIIWNGQTYPGKHEPVVTIDEFQRVRKILQRPGPPRSQKHAFAFTGMIWCGGCGLRVTAEHKFNRYEQHYVYYHCSRPRLGRRCTEPCVEIRSLEAQIHKFLQSLRIEPSFQRWALEEIKRGAAQDKDAETARHRSLDSALKDIGAQLNELINLRLRNILTDTEFLSRRQDLQQEQHRLKEKIAAMGQSTDMFEPFGDVVSFIDRAAEWFSRGSIEEKRLVLKTVSSNLVLKGKIINIEAAKPFSSLAQSTTRPRLPGGVDDVRTLQAGKKFWLKNLIEDIRVALNDPTCVNVIGNIRKLREHFEPDTPIRNLPEGNSKW